jgi:hypothetical protein
MPTHPEMAFSEHEIDRVMTRQTKEDEDGSQARKGMVGISLN